MENAIVKKRNWDAASMSHKRYTLGGLASSAVGRRNRHKALRTDKAAIKEYGL
jgi:hypothetical protein